MKKRRCVSCATPGKKRAYCGLEGNFWQISCLPVLINSVDKKSQLEKHLIDWRITVFLGENIKNSLHTLLLEQILLQEAEPRPKLIWIVLFSMAAKLARDEFPSF